MVLGVNAQETQSDIGTGASDDIPASSDVHNQYGVAIKLDSPVLNNDRLPGAKQRLPVKPRGNTEIEPDTSTPALAGNSDSRIRTNHGHGWDTDTYADTHGSTLDSSTAVPIRSSGNASIISEDDDLLTSIPPQSPNDIETPLLTPLPETSDYHPVTSSYPYLHQILNFLPVRRLVWAFEPPPIALRGTHFRLALLETFLIGLLFGLIAGPIAYYQNIINVWETSFAPLLLIKAFFLPSLFEETVFRVLLNPHPRENPSIASEQIWALVSVGLYVAWHPFNAWLLTPSARHVFYGPSFLVVTTLLGCACLAAYKRRGSVWQAVALHWAAVCVWLTLGGYADLGYQSYRVSNI